MPAWYIDPNKKKNMQLWASSLILLILFSSKITLVHPLQVLQLVLVILPLSMPCRYSPVVHTGVLSVWMCMFVPSHVSNHQTSHDLKESIHVQQDSSFSHSNLCVALSKSCMLLVKIANFKHRIWLWHMIIKPLLCVDCMYQQQVLHLIGSVWHGRIIVQIEFCCLFLEHNFYASLQTHQY